MPAAFREVARSLAQLPSVAPLDCCARTKTTRFCLRKNDDPCQILDPHDGQRTDKPECAVIHHADMAQRSSGSRKACAHDPSAKCSRKATLMTSWFIRHQGTHASQGKHEFEARTEQ